MNTIETIIEPPWYRQFWPWAILSIPVTTVLACTVLIIIAIKTDDGLVSGDYYKEGLAINRSSELEQAAVSMGITATLQLAGDRLRVVFPSVAPGDETIDISLVHNTLQNRDARLTLHRNAGGFYQSDLPTTIAGSYTITLQPKGQTWKIVQRAVLAADSTIQLTPWSAGSQQ